METRKKAGGIRLAIEVALLLVVLICVLLCFIPIKRTVKNAGTCTCEKDGNDISAQYSVDGVYYHYVIPLVYKNYYQGEIVIHPNGMESVIFQGTSYAQENSLGMANHETMATTEITYSGLFRHLNMNIRSGDGQEITIADLSL